MRAVAGLKRSTRNGSVMTNHDKLPRLRKQRHRISENTIGGMGIAVIVGLGLLAYATDNNGYTASRPESATRTAQQVPPISIAPINDPGAVQ
jgi:hypothetical protein